MSENTEKARDIIETRVFDTEVGAAWKAWSESEQVMRWWGPLGFTCPSAVMDFREGGTSLVCMRAPAEFGGAEMYNTWTYTKIVPHELIEFTMDWADKDGNRIDPSTLGLPPDMPRDVRHSITFRSVEDGKTEMIVTEYGYVSDAQFEMSRSGLVQCLDKMAMTFASSSII